MSDQRIRAELNALPVGDLIRHQWVAGRTDLQPDFRAFWKAQHQHALDLLDDEPSAPVVRRMAEVLRDATYSIHARATDPKLTYYAYTDVPVVGWYLGRTHAPFAALKRRALDGIYALLRDLLQFEANSLAGMEACHQLKLDRDAVHDRLNEIAYAVLACRELAKLLDVGRLDALPEPVRHDRLEGYAAEPHRLSALVHLTCFPQTQFHEEVAFLRTVHVGELCFFGLRTLVHETIETLRRGRLADARRCLDQALGFARLLHRSFKVLNTMPTDGFADFRHYTEEASAIQSRGYQMFDVYFRGVDPRKLGVYTRRRHLAYLARYAHPSFVSLRSLLHDPTVARGAGWTEVVAAAKALDQSLKTWRGLHLGFARKYLPPTAVGTGGSSGAPYLRTFLDGGLFPDTAVDEGVLRELFPDLPELPGECRVLPDQRIHPPEELRSPWAGRPALPVRRRCPAHRWAELRAADSPAAQAARCDLLRGSRVLVVMAGYPGEAVKTAYFERARELGVEVVLLDGPWHLADGLIDEGLVSRVIEVESLTDADAAVARVKEADLRFDGVTTFTEFGLPLVARLARELGLSGNPVEAVSLGRDKEKARRRTRDAGLPTPKFHRIRSAADLEPAARAVGFPAVLKPVAGITSIEVSRVNSEDELRGAHARAMARIHAGPAADGGPSQAMYQMMWLAGDDMILEEYLAGPEFDVDLLLCEGECVYAAVTDNLYERDAVQSGANMPSALPDDREEQLIELAVQSAVALGYTDGAFHVEVKDTPTGPALLEVNARIGGASQYELNKAVWGVDLIQEALTSCVGIPIRPDVAAAPRRAYAAAYLLAPRSGTMADGNFLDPIRNDPAVLVCDPWVQGGEAVDGPDPGPATWLGEVIVGGPDLEQAREKLRALVAGLSLPITAT